MEAKYISTQCALSFLVTFLLFQSLFLNFSLAMTLTRNRRAFSYIANETVCVVDNIMYRDGDPVPTDDPCESCKCRPPGFSCVLRECKVKPGCKAIRREGECCPEYQCGCEHNGKFFNDGDRIPNAESPCYSCFCQGSSITCALADCKFRFDCEPEYVANECCPRYDHCPPEVPLWTPETKKFSSTTLATTEAKLITTLATTTPTTSITTAPSFMPSTSNFTGGLQESTLSTSTPTTFSSSLNETAISTEKSLSETTLPPTTAATTVSIDKETSMIPDSRPLTSIFSELSTESTIEPTTESSTKKSIDDSTIKIELLLTTTFVPEILNFSRNDESTTSSIDTLETTTFIPVPAENAPSVPSKEKSETSNEENISSITSILNEDSPAPTVRLTTGMPETSVPLTTKSLITLESVTSPVSSNDDEVVEIDSSNSVTTGLPPTTLAPSEVIKDSISDNKTSSNDELVDVLDDNYPTTTKWIPSEELTAEHKNSENPVMEPFKDLTITEISSLDDLINLNSTSEGKRRLYPVF